MRWAHAQRVDRDIRIQQDYRSGKITWDEYQEAIAESREKYMVEERKSMANYKATMAEWHNRQMK